MNENALRELAGAATSAPMCKGPAFVEFCPGADGNYWLNRWTVNVGDPDGDRTFLAEFEFEQDAEFFAASREAVPELLTALRDARRLLNEFTEPNHRDNDWQDFTRGRCARCGEEWPCRWSRVWLSEHPGSGGNGP